MPIAFQLAGPRLRIKLQRSNDRSEKVPFEVRPLLIESDKVADSA